MDEKPLLLQVLDTIAGFAWPAVAVFLLLLFRRQFTLLMQRESIEFTVAGLKVSAREAVIKSGEHIVNLQERVAALEASTVAVERSQAKSPSVPEEFVHEDGSKSVSRASSRSILWVDDFPQNNAFIVSKLKEEGDNIDLEMSTAEAMRAFGRWNYDCVITDLGRIENGIENPRAGRELIREIRKTNTKIPILVFASRRALALRRELLSDGATDVTSSAVDVFKFLSRSARGA